MKKFIYLGATIGGVVGGYLGSLADHGNSFGAWGITGSTVGGLLGIWAAYKIGQNL